MYQYERKIKYYETDKMGITHHSNYIRFMEEARSEWMNYMGWSYKKCEDLGMVSPVLSVNCRYKKSTTFDDVILINLKLSKYNGMRLTVSYEMKLGEDIVATGETEHCFLNEKGMPVRIKRDYPELDEIFKAWLEDE